MKPDLRADYKIRLYTGPQNPFFEVSIFASDHLSCFRIVDPFANYGIDQARGVANPSDSAV